MGIFSNDNNEEEKKKSEPTMPSNKSYGPPKPSYMKFFEERVVHPYNPQAQGEMESVSAMPIRRLSPDEPYELSYIKNPRIQAENSYRAYKNRLAKKQQQQPKPKPIQYKQPRNFAKTLAIITFVVVIIWIVAHVINAIMNYQDMQYFKERAREGELDKETKDLINQGMKNANPNPFSHYNPYGNLK